MSPHATPSTEASLVVVGIGIQWAGQTTAAARRAIERADRVLFAVGDALAAEWIRSLNPHAESLPYPRDARPRVQIYRAMVEQILADLARGGRLCVAFYGSPAVMTAPAHLAIARARELGFSARMLPGVSFLDCLFCDLGVDPAEGCQIYEASAFLQRELPVTPSVALVLSQIAMVGNRSTFDAEATNRVHEGLQRLAARLSRFYPETHQAVLYEAATHALTPARIEHVTLARLAAASVSEVSTLYLAPIQPSADAHATVKLRAASELDR